MHLINEIETLLLEIDPSKKQDESNDLYQSYKILKRNFDVSCFNIAIRDYPIVFLRAGDIDGAYVRVLAFESVLRECQETAEPRCIMAIIKSLHGDYDDLLNLCEDVQERIDQKKQKKKKKKAEQHAAMVVDIQQAQNLSARKEAKRLYDEKEKDRLRQLKMQGKRQGVTAISDTSEYPEAMPASVLKAQKAERHRDAEEKRTEKKLLERSAYLTLPDDDTIVDPSEVEDVRKEHAFNLIELYGLTGVARRVDDAIESNRWDFTREDLVAYYEAMGCEKRSGKGSHDVIDFTKSFIFSKGDTLVTILSDFGGALTLPHWEDKVPYYLKKQIKTAREKLADLAERAMEKASQDK